MKKLTEHSILNRKYELKEGLALGYTECGDPEGSPIFCFEGWPSSRLSVWQYDELMSEAGVRLIGVDRPGMGLSGFSPDFTLLDWPDYINRLAQHLEIEHFAVLGIKSGSPFALACAYKLQESLTGCALLSPFTPQNMRQKGKGFNSLLFKASSVPFLIRPFITYYLNNLMKEEKELREELKMARVVPEKIKPDLTEVYKRMRTIAHIKEAFRAGVEGAVHEARLFSKEWGFLLEEIALKNIHLWHGERDSETDIANAGKMALAIPNCRSRFFPGEDQDSLISNSIKEIIELVRPRNRHCDPQQSLELTH